MGFWARLRRVDEVTELFAPERTDEPFFQKLMSRPPSARVIDLIALDEEGNFILGIVDLTDWVTLEKNLVLQERINLCLEFLDSGHLHQEYPSSVGKRVTIRLYLGEKPDSEGERFLAAVSEQISSFGVGFECQEYTG